MKVPRSPGVERHLHLNREPDVLHSPLAPAAWSVRLACLSLAAFTAALTQTTTKPRWHKGNLHTYTLNSDGDSTPHEVAHAAGEADKLGGLIAPR